MSEVMETIGSRIRAARLGFRWMAEVRSYVRLSDASDSTFLIEVAQKDSLPKKGAVHRCWWEHPEDGLPRDLAKIIRRRLGMEATGSFLIDDNGRKPRARTAQ